MKRLIFLSIAYLIAITMQAQQLESAEYFFDSDPGFGNGYPLIIEGEQDSVYSSIDITDLSPGLHRLYIRAKDTSGCWGLPGSKPFFAKGNHNSELERIYYSIDKEIDVATSYSYQGTEHDQIIHDTLVVEHLESGIHTLNFMATSANGNTSQIAKRMFYIPPRPGLRSLEYYYIQENDTVFGPSQRFVGMEGEEVTFESALSTDMLADKQSYSLHIMGVDMHGYRSEATVHDFEIQRPFDIVETESLSGLKIYPNPANDMITFQSSDKDIISFQIYSLSGALQKTIQRQELETQCFIGELQSGVYIIKVLSTTSGQQAGLFIKE